MTDEQVKAARKAGPGGSGGGGKGGRGFKAQPKWKAQSEGLRSELVDSALGKFVEYSMRALWTGFRAMLKQERKYAARPCRTRLYTRC